LIEPRGHGPSSGVGTTGQGDRDFAAAGPDGNLAWNAMLRLVERLYPDYKD
jgi:hypothetical protein